MKFLVSKTLQSISFIFYLNSSIFYLLKVVSQNGLEPSTSRLSVVCSSQLSYWPVVEVKLSHSVSVIRFSSAENFISLVCFSSQIETRFAGLSICFRCSCLVEISGIEPLTSCLQGRRSPSWAKPPYRWHISFVSSLHFSVPSKLNNVKTLWPSFWP